MRFSVIVTCAALAFAGSAYAQGRPAPRQPAPATVNPALVLPANMPKLATDPTVMLAQLNALTAQLSALQQEVAALKQQNSALEAQNSLQEARLETLGVEAHKLKTTFNNHQHRLVGVVGKRVATLKCEKGAGNNYSCVDAPVPGWFGPPWGLTSEHPSDWQTTSTPVVTP